MEIKIYMETIHYFLMNIDITLMMSILILLITGYILYKLLTRPIKSLKIIIAGAFLLLLGSAAWFVFCMALMYA